MRKSKQWLYFELLDGGSIKNIFQSIANGTYSFVRELSQITFAFFDHIHFSDHLPTPKYKRNL